MLTRVDVWRDFHMKIISANQVPAEVVQEITKLAMEEMELGNTVTQNLIKSLSVQNSIDALKRMVMVENKEFPYSGLKGASVYENMQTESRK